jgi:hypothetical protein
MTAMLVASEGMVADLGAIRSRRGEELARVRQRFLVECRAAGVEATDAPYTFCDARGAVADARWARRLGYRMKSLVTPLHASALNEVFTVSQKERKQAERIVLAFEKARSRGRERARVDGKLVEVPICSAAQRLLASVSPEPYNRLLGQRFPGEVSLGPVSAVVWILGAAGVVLLAVGAGTLVEARAFVAKAARAEATVVVAEESHTGPDGKPNSLKARFWVAVFTDRKGLRQSLALGVEMDAKMGPLQLGNPGKGKSLPPHGSKIFVLFDPGNPVRVKQDTFWSLWKVPIAALSLGTLVLALAVVLWIIAS